MSSVAPRQHWTAAQQPATRLALLCFGLALVVAIATNAALFADGAHYFVKTLERGGTEPSFAQRAYAQRFIELPLVIALKLGVTDLRALLFTFNLGIYLPWIIGLWLCCCLARQALWIALLGCGLGFLNTSIMSIGEHHVAHAFFWPAAFALVLVRPMTPFAAMILLASALLLLRSYESLLFLGPCLAGLALWRLFLAGERVWARLVLATAGGLFMAAAWIALQPVIDPAPNDNFSNFREGALALLQSPTPQILWCLLWIVLMAGLLLRPRVLDALPRWLLLALAGLLTLCWAGAPLLWPGSLAPPTHHLFRVLNLAVPLGLLPLLLVSSLHPWRLQRALPALATLAAVLVVIQSLYSIATSLQWHGYLGTLRAVLASERGLVAVEDTPLAQRSIDGQALNFSWYWVLPTLCIVVADEGQVRTLIHSRRYEWLPWNPRTEAELPALARYGIDYRAYLEALPATP